MAAIEVADLKAHLNLTTNTDDVLLAGKIEAAEAWVASFLGADLAEDFDVLPAPIDEAIRQLAAWFYEQREPAITGTIVAEVPFGLLDLLKPYRNWTF